MKSSVKQAEANIGLIGHVDHGKTTLTRALSGKWTDTFSEELKRGISIRLGYADIKINKCLKCKDYNAFTVKDKCNCGEKTKEERIVSLVDAPGHETLMATMISGAAILDGAILVIAANEECPQPQTEEHLEALKIIGAKNIVIAQNKIDLVSKEAAMENYKQIQKFLKTKGYESVPIIPVAANHGANVDALLKTIQEKIPTPERDLKSPARLWVARSFEVNKPGTTPDDLKGGILGGSLERGVLKAGDEIEISPGIENGPTTTKIVSISTANGLIKEGRPGGLLAVSTELDPYLTKSDKLKGSVIGPTKTVPKAVTTADVKVNLMERVLGDQAKKPLQTNERIVIAIGTGVTTATITSVKKDKDAPIASIQLMRPLAMESGQKAVLSRNTGSGWRLSGYGIVQ